MPHDMPEHRVEDEVLRELPPELGPNTVAILEGDAFMFSEATGDVPRGSIGGLVFADTRFLDCWRLTLNGSPLLVLESAPVKPYAAAFFLTNPDLPGLRANSVGVRRQRLVGRGVEETITLQCFSTKPAVVQLRLEVGADFADILEIKETVTDRSDKIARQHAADGSRLSFAYENGPFSATVKVLVEPAADRVEGDDLVWDLYLEPGEKWACELKIPCFHGPATHTYQTAREFQQVFDGDTEDPAHRWRAAAPTLTADYQVLRNLFEKSVDDLVALRIQTELNGQRMDFPAAGLPWFLSMFGRDSLITAYQTVCFGPRLTRGALRTLATYQGDEVDDFRDEEPGKIIHEVRSGELTRLGIKPYDPYYGTADATPLWLIMLSEYWRWTLDDQLVQDLRDNVHAALRWIDEYGDRDGDGYVEYATRSPQGLGNQCWRDSWDGVQFHDGRIPVLPIATCEIQGYTYDAKLRIAELADGGGPLNDPALAQRLRAEAEELRARFNRDFWIEDRGGYYAIGLDGDKRKIDSMTSNMGHLLWSGIVPEDRAAIVARQLMSDEMFSGWGVRTVSTAERGYNPIGYHMGTVWPHDNSLIAHGLARYGYRQEANRIITAMLDAAQTSEFRLPEAFSGYEREFSRIPVRYPTACNPQAWASGAPLLFLRTMLGLDARDGRLVLDPALPEGYGRRILLAGTNAFGSRWDIELRDGLTDIRPTH
ncbi:glycogen debranching protein [Micromonospora sp. S4605]|uniref:amylo-alpha-1,6-glucosidase n=1 Tax=Micromonospora sp. S4605 TaxID=1420897 RepID=UPI000D6F8299|nr:glycogen debranching N-terminal domain-containing protein [Micromonospora sp. S4605]PWU56041.1 glycogen debranching protein [Micromonospora sp. S4605]